MKDVTKTVFSAAEVKPAESQRGKWLWWERGGYKWLCFWDGGDRVDCHGPFNFENRPVPVINQYGGEES